jgi:hypothetical protein
VLLRANHGHPCALGELLVEPNRLPGRECRRLAGIGRSRAAPTAKGGIASPQVFPGSFVRSKGRCVTLLNCVENRRKFKNLQNQFFWIRCDEYYNFCYSYMAWFWIFLTWKIGLWNALIFHNSKPITPLHLNFGYVVCLVMTSSCAKSCTKLCSKCVYINCFPFLQKLARWFL